MIATAIDSVLTIVLVMTVFLMYFWLPVRLQRASTAMNAKQFVDYFGMIAKVAGVFAVLPCVILGLMIWRMCELIFSGGWHGAGVALILILTLLCLVGVSFLVLSWAVLYVARHLGLTQGGSHD